MKRVSIESGSDARVFSGNYADNLRVYVDDRLVYDSSPSGVGNVINAIFEEAFARNMEAAERIIPTTVEAVEREEQRQEIEAELKANKHIIDHLRLTLDRVKAERDQLRDAFVNYHSGETIEQAIIRWNDETFMQGVSYRLISERLQADLAAARQRIDVLEGAEAELVWLEANWNHFLRFSEKHASLGGLRDFIRDAMAALSTQSEAMKGEA